MSNPTIYGFDDAGCKWETVHKNDHASLIASVNSRINALSEKVIPIVWNGISQSIFRAVYDICYGNGKYIAVGSNSSSKAQMAYSTDGITWTPISPTIFTGQFVRSICYANGKFVAVGYSGQLAYSTDGLTWAQAAAGLTTETINSVCYGNGKFVACNAYGQILYSTDGINWTLKGTGYTSVLHAVCYGNGKFVAVGSNGNNFYSTDGITWTRMSHVGVNVSLMTVCYGDGKFVATNYRGNVIYYSTDGITWQTKTFSELDTSSNAYRSCYVGGKFIMTIDNTLVCISSDFNTSIIININLSNCYCFSFLNHRYFIGNDSGTMKYCQVGV